MDREGRRRYFIFGSAILEIVTPVFKDKLNTECNGNLQAFMNTQPVIHKMFHLHHRYVWCCVDQPNCTNNQALPLNSNQWNSLYAENPGPGRHHCHCKYTAKPIQLDDLDLTLAGLILVNCCNLSGADEQAIRILRQYRNDYFAHNTDGTIAQADYDRLWPFLTSYVLQLNNSKHADLAMIQIRPLDESLCNKYATQLLDVHQRLDEINSSIEGNNFSTEQNNDLLHGLTTSSETASNILTVLNTSTAENNAIARENNQLLKGVSTSMQVLVHYAEKGIKCRCQPEPPRCQPEVLLCQPELTNTQGKVKSKPYKLGQSIFKLHYQTDLSTVFGVDRGGEIADGVMMDDGRLVLCHWSMFRLLICNTDSSDVHSIPVNGLPWRVTAVNNTTVAITLAEREFIELYDINIKHKLKSVQVQGMRASCGITIINNRLVLGGKNCLYIIDHQTRKKLQTIDTGHCDPVHLHASGERTFYCGRYHNKNLYCYNHSDGKYTKTTLPSEASRITSLKDSSLYVKCDDGSVQHVSSDGQHYKPVTTTGLKSLNTCYVISYNQKQRKLFTCGICTEGIKIFKKSKFHV